MTSGGFRHPAGVQYELIHSFGLQIGVNKDFLNGPHFKKSLIKSTHGGLRTLLGHHVTGSVVLCAGFGVGFFFFHFKRVVYKAKITADELEIAVAERDRFKSSSPLRNNHC